jgi:DNA polymerase-3 subunit gamma/tau
MVKKANEWVTKIDLPPATLVIETNNVVAENKSTYQPIVVPATLPQTVAPATPKGIGSLQKIRQQISDKNQVGIEKKPLTQQELATAWQAFIDVLQSNNNYSAVTNFKESALQILNENEIEIIVKGSIHKTFIEVERPALITHLQKYFNNTLLTYQLRVDEVENNEPKSPAPLTRNQQYIKMIENYPLVKELKERLKLELE